MSREPTSEPSFSSSETLDSAALRTVKYLLRWFACALAVCAALLAVVVLQVSERGERLMAESDRAFDRGDLAHATDSARSAAVAYLPGASHVKRAYDRLEAVALGSAVQRDARTSLAAWTALRSALIETSHPWVNTQPLLETANKRIAQLLVSELGAARAEEAGAVNRAYAQAGSALPKFALFTSLGAACMLGSVWFWCTRASSTRRNGLNVPRVVMQLALLGGLVLWIVAAVGA